MLYVLQLHPFLPIKAARVSQIPSKTTEFESTEHCSASVLDEERTASARHILDGEDGGICHQQAPTALDRQNNPSVSTQAHNVGKEKSQYTNRAVPGVCMEGVNVSVATLWLNLSVTSHT